MPTIILISGLPGNGKSTLARQLASRTNGQFLDIDDYKKVVADPTLVKSEIDPPHIRRIYYRDAIMAAFGVLQTGVPVVIMEEVFHLAALRDEISSMCSKANVHVLWIEVTCPYEIVESRLRSNGREGHILSTDEALRMHRLFEGVFEPFPHGNCFRVDNSDGELDLAVEDVMKHIPVLSG